MRNNQKILTTAAEISKARKEALAQFTREITATPEASFNYLYKNGFITKSGKLTKYYRQPS